MKDLQKRLDRLEAAVPPPRRPGFQIIYDATKTDLSIDDFVAAEMERLGVTDDQGGVIWEIVYPNLPATETTGRSKLGCSDHVDARHQRRSGRSFDWDL